MDSGNLKIRRKGFEKEEISDFPSISPGESFDIQRVYIFSIT